MWTVEPPSAQAVLSTPGLDLLIILTRYLGRPDLAEQLSGERQVYAGFMEGVILETYFLVRLDFLSRTAEEQSKLLRRCGISAQQEWTAHSLLGFPTAEN